MYAPVKLFGVPDTRRGNVRSKVNGSVRKCCFFPQNTFPRNEKGGVALTGMLSVLKSVQKSRRYSLNLVTVLLLDRLAGCRRGRLPA